MADQAYAKPFAAPAMPEANMAAAGHLQDTGDPTYGWGITKEDLAMGDEHIKSKIRALMSEQKEDNDNRDRVGAIANEVASELGLNRGQEEKLQANPISPGPPPTHPLLNMSKAEMRGFHRNELMQYKSYLDAIDDVVEDLKSEGVEIDKFMQAKIDQAKSLRQPY